MQFSFFSILQLCSLSSFSPSATFLRHFTFSSRKTIASTATTAATATATTSPGPATAPDRGSANQQGVASSESFLHPPLPFPAPLLASQLSSPLRSATVRDMCGPALCLILSHTGRAHRWTDRPECSSGTHKPASSSIAQPSHIGGGILIWNFRIISDPTKND